MKRRFLTQKASREKGCPRIAYLGLCSEGMVKGVLRSNYVKPSSLNKAYAVKAVRLLRSDPLLAEDKRELWNRVQNGNKKAENNQMDVVLSLWKENLIVR